MYTAHELSLMGAEVLPDRRAPLTIIVAPVIGVSPVIAVAVNNALALNAATINSTSAAIAGQIVAAIHG